MVPKKRVGRGEPAETERRAVTDPPQGQQVVAPLQPAADFLQGLGSGVQTMRQKWKYDPTTGLGTKGTGIRTSEELQRNTHAGHGVGLGYSTRDAGHQSPAFSFTAAETTGGSQAE